MGWNSWDCFGVDVTEAEVMANAKLMVERLKIEEGHTVLDLGCGDGTLLAYVRDERNVTGYGLEISPFNVEECVEKQVNVIQADLNDGLKAYFADSSFEHFGVQSRFYRKDDGFYVSTDNASGEFYLTEVA